MSTHKYYNTKTNNQQQQRQQQQQQQQQKDTKKNGINLNKKDDFPLLYCLFLSQSFKLKSVWSLKLPDG